MAIPQSPPPAPPLTSFSPPPCDQQERLLLPSSDRPPATPYARGASPMTQRQHQQQQQHRRRRHAAVFAAFVCFGLASWIMTNVTYVELGAFLRVLPEEYSIYAYSIFALESANIYPFLYMLINYRRQRMNQSLVIWWLLAQGIVVAVLMSALWSYTTSVGGKRHSIAMLVLTHLGGMVSTTSSVVFYPFVATYSPVYTSALSTGEGLSGSMAALLGVIQEPYDEASMRFSVSVFYMICAIIMCVSIVGFAFLQFHPWAIVAAAPSGEESVDVDGQRSSRGVSIQASVEAQVELEDDAEHAPLVRNGCGPCPATATETTATGDKLVAAMKKEQRGELSQGAIFKLTWQFLVCQYVLAAFSFGVLPSVMPYVYKKYAPEDNLEAETSRYQTTSSIAALILDPVARIVTSRWRAYYVRASTVFLIAVASMLLSFSLTSVPVLSQDHYTDGYLLPLLSHVFYLVFYAYTQTMIYYTLKRTSEHQPRDFARQAYQWSGFATQLGAMTGTAIIFPLVFFREDLFTA